jgi:hypothetical protein
MADTAVPRNPGAEPPPTPPASPTPAAPAPPIPSRHPPTTDPTGGGSTAARATSSQLAVGNNQWIELRVKIKDLIRVGTDPTRGLAHIAAAEILVSGEGPAVGITVDYDSLYLTGGFGPDVGEIGDPYVYRYRYRSTLTGEVSNVSPSSRGGVLPRRGRVDITPAASTDAQADRIDYFRLGGALNRWTFVGTGLNSAAAFHDDVNDSAIDGAETPPFDDFQPWITLATNAAGKATLAGNALLRTSGDLFNLTWAPGSLILVNNKALTLDQVLSTSVLLTVENGGSGANLDWSLPAPELLAQPLPAIWASDTGVVFACGDPRNPGTLYWTKPGNPDVTSDRNSLQVTSGVEPLQHGWCYDQICYVASTENVYAIESDPTTGGFRTRLVPTGKGLKYSRWAFAVAPEGVYFLTTEGIALTSGGGPARYITDPDLKSLFPEGGVAGVSVRGIDPPDLTQHARLRLARIGSYLYFDYATATGHDRTLIFDRLHQRWYFDQYAASGFSLRAPEEGEGDLNQMAGDVGGAIWIADDGAFDLGGGVAADTPIAWGLDTSQVDFGDPRAEKQLGDAILDCDPALETITLTPLSGMAAVALPATVLAAQNGRSPYIIGIDQHPATYAISLGLSIRSSTSSSSAAPILYLWEPAILVKPALTLARATDWSDLGTPSAKFIQGVLIRANTFGVPKSVQVEYDGGATGTTVALTLACLHDGESTIAYPRSSSGWTPFVAHLVRLVGVDAIPWLLDESALAWVFEPAPELATEWMTPVITHDLPGYFHARDLLVGISDAASPVLVELLYDGVPDAYTLTPSSAAYARIYQLLRARKGRSLQYRLTSATPFRLYKQDTIVRVAGWGVPTGYQLARPFGGQSLVSGAEV